MAGMDDPPPAAAIQEKRAVPVKADEAAADLGVGQPGGDLLPQPGRAIQPGVPDRPECPGTG